MSINTQQNSANTFAKDTFKDEPRTQFVQQSSQDPNKEGAGGSNNNNGVAAGNNKHDINSQLTKSNRIVTSLLSGGIAGGLAKTVIAPLDRSKIFFQTNETRNYRFRYAIRWLRHGYRTEGLLSLWRGNSATMARILPYAAIQFMSHEQYKAILKTDQKDTPKIMRFLAGSMAGVTGQLATYPLDKVRAVMAVTNRKGEYKSLVQVVLKIHSEEGLLALYRGLTPTMMGVVLYAGTSFFTYETLKEAAASSRSQNDEATTEKAAAPNIYQRLLSGAVAGLLGQTSSYPLDIVRRRMQTGVSLGKGNKYRTLSGTFLYVLRNEGIRRGLYKGLSMNFIKGPIATSISFTTYDYVKMGLQWLFLATKS
eukprot:TRINITY_DN8066_c0_g1_i5.p1 TRINITY_DN8066_c0_g1~~TRINITY_DN8066_c0_g1_i5.p1  ORF type:complete len:366 (-),score=73.61 TRINITY_DN8066_c0_g1_i5:314-1411(-)